MKIKSIFLIGLLILTFVSSTAIYAETVNVGDSSFILPEGFTVNETENKQVALQNNTSFIVVHYGDTVSTEDARQKRINLGYTFIDEDTYDVNDIKVNQQNYIKNNVTACVYTFTKDDKNYIIVLTLNEGDTIPSMEDNPVIVIINSLK